MNFRIPISIILLFINHITINFQPFSILCKWNSFSVSTWLRSGISQWGWASSNFFFSIVPIVSWIPLLFIIWKVRILIEALLMIRFTFLKLMTLSEWRCLLPASWSLLIGLFTLVVFSIVFASEWLLLNSFAHFGLTSLDNIINLISNLINLMFSIKTSSYLFVCFDETFQFFLKTIILIV